MAGLLQRAIEQHQAGSLVTAELNYRAVLAVDPRQQQALHYLGVLLGQTGRVDAAVESLSCAVQADPDNLEAALDLSGMLVALGRADAAICELERVLRIAPDFSEGWAQLGGIHMRLGQFGRAGACFERNSALDPQSAVNYHNLGVARQAEGNLEAAAAAYRSAVSNDTTYAASHNNLGLIERSHARHEVSVDCFRRAIAAAPDILEYRVNLGVAFRHLGQLDEALQVFVAILSIAPHRREALQGAGAVHSDRGDHQSAAKYFDLLIQQEPNNVAALIGLGAWHLSQYRSDLARELLERAVKLSPHSAPALSYLGTAVLLTSVDLAAGLSCFRRALELEPDLAFANSNLLFAMHYDSPLDADKLAEAHIQFETRHAAPLRSTWRPHINESSPTRRIKIGYVSGDFRDHSCAYFIEPLIDAHDRNAVEVHCFSNSEKADAVTARIRSKADHWYDICRLDDTRSAELVRKMEIDILVDLAGHTAANRMSLFARKPAPVQVTWLGYPNTTGLKAIDYRITDYVADPPGQSGGRYSERLIRLPHGFLSYRPSDEAPAVADLPANSHGAVTFGCFNNLLKINQDVIRLWARLLRIVPDARLALKDTRLGNRNFASSFVAKFVDLGIAADRIVLLPPLAGQRQFLALYGGVDIGLDPFPYNGTTTTCEALWMGVPVVTLRGEHHAGRVGASLLHAIGRNEWVAPDQEAYLRIAANLASDLHYLASERSQLRNIVQNSSLCDCQNFARDVESAYRSIWSRWCLSVPGK